MESMDLKEEGAQSKRALTLGSTIQVELTGRTNGEVTSSRDVSTLGRQSLWWTVVLYLCHYGGRGVRPHSWTYLKLCSCILTADAGRLQTAGRKRARGAWVRSDAHGCDAHAKTKVGKKRRPGERQGRQVKEVRRQVFLVWRVWSHD